MIKRYFASVFIVILALFVITVSTNGEEIYTDVNNGAWYYDNVMDMTSRGLLQGYDDGTFKPESKMTYAEFGTVLVRCTGGSATRTSGGHWAESIMKYAYENRWYDYDEVNEQKYDLAIPRYMAVKMLVFAMNIPANEQENNSYYRYMNEIKDFNSIDGRYAYLVVRGYCNGIINGDEHGNFDPYSDLTRAEACAIISRALGGSVVPAQNEAIAARTPVKRGGSVSENGWLKISGTQLVNAAGEPVVLHGMSSHGLHWFPQFVERDAIAFTAEKGANLYRAAMYTAEGGYVAQPEKCKQLLVSAVDNAIAEDMYVIVDWHILSDGDPMTYVEQSKTFFSEISAKYAAVPNVIYEICNEPNGNVSWEGSIKPYAEAVIPVIRANSPDSVILVGSGTWSQEVDKPADDPLGFSDIMYTCHFYAGTHGQWLRDRIDKALSKGAPIFISEWGTSAADGNGGIFLDESRKWLDFLDARNISWVNWSLCDKNESSAALAAGASGEYRLSESGNFVFSNF